jgi:AcrR family transcriptional regulator
MSSPSTRRDPDARSRLLTAAQDLFGRQGYKATTVAEIEAAAGLSPGAGGMYRHFPSKRALLEAGLEEQLESGPSLAALLGSAPPPGDLRDQLLAIARAALARLDHERNLNRLLLRDLSDFPELLAGIRDRELRRTHAALAQWLTAKGTAGTHDPAAVATVLMGAVSHYWILTDVFSGEHPFAPDRDAFLAALADLALGALSRSG